MRAYELNGPGLDRLVAVERPDPEPGWGEVVIRQNAASLNYIGVAVANGTYPGVRYPVVPVADAAGTIAAVGPGVSGWSVGDRVMPHFKSAWLAGKVGPQVHEGMRGLQRPGALATHAVAAAATLVRTPDHLDDIQASTLSIAATTAWCALRTAAIGPGDTVLLLGTGGVSIVALQLAKAAGARVIVTSSSGAKLARAKALGADDGIDYRATPDWDREVLARTGGEGARLVIESGGGDTFAQSIAATAFGGVVFLIGFLGGTTASVDLLPVIQRAVRIQGHNTGSVADFAEAVRAIASHRIAPVVDRVFPWTAAREAYEWMASGSRFGKVALTIDG